MYVLRQNTVICGQEEGVWCQQKLARAKLGASSRCLPLTLLSYLSLPHFVTLKRGVQSTASLIDNTTVVQLHGRYDDGGETGSE